MGDESEQYPASDTRERAEAIERELISACSDEALRSGMAVLLAVLSSLFGTHLTFGGFMRVGIGKWDQASVPEGIAVFAHGMDEALYMGTLLPYRPPLLSTHTLALEGLETIADIRNGECRKANIDVVLDEMEWRLRSDPAARSVLGGGKASSIADDFRRKDRDLAENEVRLRVIESALSGRYLAEIKRQLKTHIADGHDKSSIQHLTAMLVSELASLGEYSHPYMYRVTREFFFDLQCEPESVKDSSDLDDFFARLEREKAPWDAYIAVNRVFERCIGFIGNWAQRWDLDVELVLRDDFKPPNLGITEALAPKRYAMVLKIGGIEARTPEEAWVWAQEFLSDVARLYSFEFHGKSLAWDPVFEIWDPSAKRRRTVGPPPTPMKSPIERPLETALTRLEEVTEGVGVTPYAMHQYGRVVELHNMAQRDRGSGNQLLDLWAILESIVPALDKETPTISHVCNTLAPLVRYRHFADLLGVLFSELMTWNQAKTLAALDSVGEGSRFRSLTALLAAEECAPKCDEFIDDLVEHPLLCYRVSRLRLVLGSPKHIAKELDIAARRATWDLHRAYRTRNEFVHAAQVRPELSRHLVGQLHQYVDSFVRLLMDLICLRDGVDDFHAALTEADLSCRLQTMTLTEGQRVATSLGNYVEYVFADGSVLLRDADALGED